jgi:hypothetical protein
MAVKREKESGELDRSYTEMVSPCHKNAFFFTYTEIPIEVSLLNITQRDPMWDRVLGDVKSAMAGIVLLLLCVPIIR